MTKVSELVSQNVGNAITNYNTWNSLLFNVKSYGAKGDGVTSDTVAIQAAINAAVANGSKLVYFPKPASSYLTGTLTNTSSVFLVGDNATTTGVVYAIEQFGKFNGGAVGKHIEFVDTTVASNQSSMVISRDANFTGGTPGFTNSGLYVYDTVRAGVTSYEWGITSELNNYSDTGQHVGISTYAHQRALSSTWGLNVVAWKHGTNAATAGLIGIELGLVADGADVNNVRIGLDLGASPDVGTAPTFYCGIRLGAGNGDANAGTFINGILLNSKMTTAIKVNSNHTIGIDFATSTSPANITQMRLRNYDQIAMDTAGIIVMRYHAGNDFIEFLKNGVRVGYVNMIGADHAL